MTEQSHLPKRPVFLRALCFKLTGKENVQEYVAISLGSHINESSCLTKTNHW
jgi:hypothetical protein